MNTIKRLVACIVAAISATASGTARPADDMTIYQNARHGFMIAYPTEAFELEPANESEDGRLLVTRDGKTKLLIGAFVNDEKTSLSDYRTFLMQQNYPNAQIDYAPVRERWFILSGIRDGMVFYERVTFTCGGQLINSWALLYPEAEKTKYDRLVERLARTYSPGAGRDGRCKM